jgi:hypothetical protein
MSPKTSIAEHLRTTLTPMRAEPEVGDDDDQEDFNPPLNQQGAIEFDRTVGSPAGRGNRSATSSASASSTRAITDSRDDFILQQSAQQEQLKQMFALVSNLSCKIESVVEVVAGSSSGKPDEQQSSGPSQQEKDKAAIRNISFAPMFDELEEEEDDGDIDDLGSDNVDGYVSHGLYRDIIAEGFVRLSPSKQARLLPHRRPRHEDSCSLKVFSKSARIQHHRGQRLFRVSQPCGFRRCHRSGKRGRPKGRHQPPQSS